MTTPRRNASLFRVFIVYLAAIAAGAATFFGCPEAEPLWRLLLADGVATVVVYGASVGAANTSFYDAYWSVAPPLLLMLGWALPSSATADSTRQLLLLLPLSYWSLRLTWNWARGWTGLDHEDWRYVAYRQQLPAPVFELVNFGGLHFFPTLIVFLALSGGFFAWTAPGAVGPLAWLGAAVITGGTSLQLIADNQLRAFRLDKQNQGRILHTGAWRWSRHPNYFGEVCVWWGVWAVGMDAAAPWWTLAGPLAITGLFVFISIPLLERRMAERRPDWAAHVQQTRALLPLPRRPPAP